MNIKESWEKLIQYRFAQEPKLKKYQFVEATLKDIERIESVLQVELPSSFKESMLISCGEINVDKEDQDITTWFGDWNILMNHQSIIDETIEYSKIDFDWSATYDILNVPKGWPRELIVFLNNNNDYFVAMDLRDERGDEKGQILCIALEGGIIAKWADSYEKWFEMAVEEVIKYDELRLETIENLLRIK